MTGPPAAAPASSDAGQVTGVTDPRIIKQGDTYYAFSSGPGIEIRASNDLTHWREIGQVFATVPGWALAKVQGATSVWRLTSPTATANTACIMQSRPTEANSR